MCKISFISAESPTTQALIKHTCPYLIQIALILVRTCIYIYIAIRMSTMKVATGGIYWKSEISSQLFCPGVSIETVCLQRQGVPY